MKVAFRAHLRGMLRAASCGMLAVSLLAVAGCLYPDDQTPGSGASAREAVLTVQDAVDRYQEATGLLPIMNADRSVPLYEKFKVDLGKLKRMGYLSTIPSAAFESGGKDQFLIIDEETDPKVKLLDLVVYQSVASVQKKVNDYMDKRGGQAPAGEEVYPGFYALDFGKLGTEEPDVRSMFSGQSLTFLVDGGGTVYLDYGVDIATAIRKSGAVPDGKQDLRRLLVDASYYVPVKSPVYNWVNGAPQAVPERK
jgi:hypothetical protein